MVFWKEWWEIVYIYLLVSVGHQLYFRILTYIEDWFDPLPHSGVYRTRPHTLPGHVPRGQGRAQCHPPYANDTRHLLRKNNNFEKNRSITKPFFGIPTRDLLEIDDRSVCISYAQVWKDLAKDIPMNLKDFLLGRKLFEGIRDKTGEYDECQRRYYPDWNR